MDAEKEDGIWAPVDSSILPQAAMETWFRAECDTVGAGSRGRVFHRKRPCLFGFRVSTP